MRLGGGTRLPFVDCVDYGWALDLHTISSKFLGTGIFDNQRSEIGEMLYQIKYCNLIVQEKIEIANNLALKATKFLQQLYIFSNLNAIIPTPSSKDREFQPVYYIADKIGQIMDKRVDLNYIKKIKETNELKGIDDPEERKKILQGSFIVDKRYKNGSVLIFDDLFRSGSTIAEIARTLKFQGEVRKIYVLCLTKTRTKR